jgi:uncharacterized membrane protein
MKQELISLILGEATIVTYIGAFIFVLFGLVIKWYFKIKSAVKTNENSPPVFSWGYFISQNLFTKLFSIFANMIICFVVLRFSTELINVPVSMLFALSVGMLFDYFVDFLRKWQGNLKNKV